MHLDARFEEILGQLVVMIERPSVWIVGGIAAPISLNRGH